MRDVLPTAIGEGVNAPSELPRYLKKEKSRRQKRECEKTRKRMVRV